jgi:hypothetical protein
MKLMATIILIAVSSMFAVTVDAQHPTEALVQEFLVKFDKAIAAKNAAEIGKLLSEDAEISGTFNIGGRARPVKFNKPQYMAGLTETWTQAANHIYRRTNQQILVSAGKATVTADVFESMIVRSQYVALKTKEVWTLERIDGVLVLTRLVATGLMRGS